MQCTSPGQHTMSLRGKSEAKDAAIHCMQWSRTGNAVRFTAHSESPRAFALAMTRWWGRMWVVRLHRDLCHCEERAERGTRQSTVCNGRVRTMRFASLLTVDRHGLSALAMTRCGSDAVYLSRTTHHVIARKERSEGRGNPLHAMNAIGFVCSLPSSQWIATGLQPSR